MGRLKIGAILPVRLVVPYSHARIFTLAASHKNEYRETPANAAATERSHLVFAPVGSADQRRPATPEIGGVAPWSLAFVPYASVTCR